MARVKYRVYPTSHSLLELVRAVGEGGCCGGAYRQVLREEVPFRVISALAAPYEEQGQGCINI